jgi:4-amino-4-deoxy-L-arabinose transferase-like glycosyltransferase
MAQTGDLVTPRLWGAPWFEKPPLLYWMTAAGTLAGVNADLAGRLPVALLSLFFLAVSFVLLRREFGFASAAISTALLATCAGWITYSGLCLTDLPLAVFFSLAVYAALPLLRDQPRVANLSWRFLALGACLGLAVLAKGLVPIVLALPFFWFLRPFWRKWWLAITGCLIVAAPWYALVTARNGYPFIQEFFLRHHFERLYSASLQHVQPWYYYVPVLLGGLFPWTPLFGLLAWREPAWDRRRRFLATVIVFGFLFFSATRNKLPGYLLPLLPSAFALLGAQFEAKRLSLVSRAWLIPCAVLIAAIPLLAPVLPESLSLGKISLAGLTRFSRTELFYIALPIVAVLLARRSWAGTLLVLCVVSGGLYLKHVSYPTLDKEVSARSLWRHWGDLPGSLCESWAGRDWVYGLSFYRGALIPPCSSGQFSYELRPHNHEKPTLERLK